MTTQPGHHLATDAADDAPPSSGEALDLLVVTWQGGGVMQPALGVGRELTRRGHRVRMVAPKMLAARVADAGCAHVPQPASLERDPGDRRSIEDTPGYLDLIFQGSELADEVARQVDARRPDFVVADYFLGAVRSRLDEQGVPHAALVHMAYGFFRYDLPTATDVVVALPAELDDPPSPQPNVTHVGLIAETPTPTSWASPWPSDERPLVVVSFGTTYMQQEDLTDRVVDALATLPVRVLVLTGDEVDPGSVQRRGDMQVERYVPHGSVLPHAALLVSHAGMGSVVAAASAGVPMMCIPLGRDQHHNAGLVSQLGYGATASAEDDVETLRAAFAHALASADFRSSAQRLRSSLSRYGGAAAAADVVQRRVNTTAS